MSRHNRVLILYGLVSVIILALIFYDIISIYWFVGMTLGYISILTYTSLNMDSNYYLDSITYGDRSDNVVAITFDDGPDIANTSVVLDILKERNIKAAFFCIGKKVSRGEAIIQRMFNEGHIIGNHSYAHKAFLDFMPAGIVEKDLNRTNEVIGKIIGQTPVYYRPPFGVTTPAIARAVNKQNMLSIGWNNRSFDTSVITNDVILARIKAKLKPGSILLLHDILDRQKSLLPEILDVIEELSFRVIPLDELINKRPYV